MEYLSTLFRYIVQVIHNGQWSQLGIWSYFILAGLVAVEGPIATLLGAAAASAGLMKPEWVFIAAATGNLTADSLWYTIGYLGKVDWFLRFGKRLGVKGDILELLEAKMRQHATRILFICKLTLSMMIPALIAAGLVKAPWKRWFPAIFTGEMIWTGFLVIVGFYVTEAIKRVEQGLALVALAGTIILISLLIGFIQRVVKQHYHIEFDRDKKE